MPPVAPLPVSISALASGGEGAFSFAEVIASADWLATGMGGEGAFSLAEVVASADWLATGMTRSVAKVVIAVAG